MNASAPISSQPINYFLPNRRSCRRKRTLKTAAKANSMENFKPVFDRMLEGLFIDRMEGNEDIFDRLMNDPEVRNIAANELLRGVYNRLRN
jgi:type I restriction enzyme, R subunit